MVWVFSSVVSSFLMMSSVSFLDFSFVCTCPAANVWALPSVCRHHDEILLTKLGFIVLHFVVVCDLSEIVFFSVSKNYYTPWSFVDSHRVLTSWWSPSTIITRLCLLPYSISCSTFPLGHLWHLGTVNADQDCRLGIVSPFLYSSFCS